MPRSEEGPVARHGVAYLRAGEELELVLAPEHGRVGLGRQRRRVGGQGRSDALGAAGVEEEQGEPQPRLEPFRGFAERAGVDGGGVDPGGLGHGQGRGAPRELLGRGEERGQRGLSLDGAGGGVSIIDVGVVVRRHQDDAGLVRGGHRPARDEPRRQVGRGEVEARRTMLDQCYI